MTPLGMSSANSLCGAGAAVAEEPPLTAASDLAAAPTFPLRADRGSSLGAEGAILAAEA